MTSRSASLGLLLVACLVAAGFLDPASVAAHDVAPTPRWQATLDRVNPAVVVLRVSVPRYFDTETPTDELATGFVVDALRGLILTNRHVVKPGPATIEAVFLDNEEVSVEVVYRDPVHDFGIVRYDPADVKFMTPGEIELVPDHARVGTEIRVVGNDAGEKLSILAGTLARLDRDAPQYGRNLYSDFNTFYYQAASGTSGGSSGSPVVDVHGHAVALNAGGARHASSSFYLPLEPVVRALDLIRKGEPVPRGTLQTVFRYRPYDEVRRLGLRAETEASVRRSQPSATGMLVVDEVVPGGPAEGRLEVGDVLVKIAGRDVTRFGALGSLLDDHVGEELTLAVERGGEPISVVLGVQDLYAITPKEYLDVGGAVAHPLSYQQARNHGVRVGAVYLASPGYVFGRAGIERGVIITAVGGRAVATLDEFEERIASLAHGTRVPVRTVHLEAPRDESVAVVIVDRLWFKMERCALDASSGEWRCRASPPPPPPPPPAAAKTSFESEGEPTALALAPSLAMVDFDIPFRVDGVHGDRFKGTGLVVDAERGLVVVDRETVPIALGDVQVTFAASVQIPGEVVYLHPAHNLAVVRYDPALLFGTPVRSAKLLSKSLEPGDEVWLVGLGEEQRLVSRKTRISRLEAHHVSPSTPPRFREKNIELIRLTDSVPTLGGVLSDKKGRVVAQWAAFSTDEETAGSATIFAGISARIVSDLLALVEKQGGRVWRSLGAELRRINLADARNLGLDEETARDIESRRASRRSVLAVARLTAGTSSAALLREGDLLLSIGGQPATSFAAVESAAQAERVSVTLLRDGKQLTVEIATTPQHGHGTNRFVFWGGATLQMPHPAVSADRGVEPVGVYVSWFWFGSPASRSDLRATRRIVEVDGVPTPNLDAFLAAVADRSDARAVRLKTLDLEDKADVVTLKPDPQFWSTSEIRRGPKGWERIEH